MSNSDSAETSFTKPNLPQGAESYLQRNNPRLIELRKKYDSLSLPVTDQSVWTSDYASHEVDLEYFRADNAYIWQTRERNQAETNYLIITNYVKSIDSLKLLGILKEDGMFGAHVFDFDDRLVVSRDLLDSILEIYFLEQTIEISESNLNILDIGAGYGRLAHRFVTAFPNLGQVFCVDAVAESTFLCEYYLRFRDVDNRATVVQLDKIDNALATTHVDLAVNVSSFSECTLASVSWWLDLLREHEIRYLMIVPNPPGTELVTREKGWEREPDWEHTNCIDYLSALNSRGYKQIVKWPKYLDSHVQKYGVTPTHYYFFELT
jgi:SAM-dependent methyltransferase